MNSILWVGLYIFIGIITTVVCDYIDNETDQYLAIGLGIFWPVTILAGIIAVVLVIWSLLAELISNSVKCLGEGIRKLIKIRRIKR